MHLFAAVGGAGQRQLLVVQPGRIRSTAFNQRQGLERLDRRARVDRPLDIAQSQNRLTIAAHHTNGAAVKTFHKVPAREIYENRV